MGSIKKILLFSGLLLVASGSFSQEIFPAVQRLKDYCRATAPTGYSPRLNILTLTPKNNLH